MTVAPTDSDVTGRVDSMAHVVRIGNREVGSGRRPYVIAEAGVNHNGDEKLALRMVRAASEAGADAVKFQVFRAETLTTAAAPTAEYQSCRTEHSSQREMLARLELADDGFQRVAECCAERGITFLATPFSTADVDRLIALDAAAIKIASTDIVDLPLIERACCARRPIILSTGAADEREIAAAVACVEACGAADHLVLLHCVSAYPTPLGAANLAAIGALARRFSTPVGFSDHTTSTLAGALAVAAGACVLEKHFTLDAAAAGPDHAVSLEPDGLREYIRLAHGAFEALGDGTVEVQSIEQDVRRIGRKTIVAARDIAPGETLTASDVTTKRAGSGLTPDVLSRLLGRRTTAPIRAETPILWEMVS